MSEFRLDPVSGQRVIIAENRASRPHEFQTSPVRIANESCPFCAGNEHETPTAVATYPQTSPAGADADWQVRVVPNKYPAVQLDEPAATSECGMFHTSSGAGLHEVIIESPQHHVSFSQLGDEQAALVMVTYRDRILAHAKGGRVNYVQIFKNCGPAAGATLEHVHSQLIGLPDTPLVVASELENCRRKAHGDCLFFRMLAEESAAELRIVTQTENFVAFCPFASRFAFETWILPRRHASDFQALDDNSCVELAAFLKTVICRLEDALQRPAYNYSLHTAPLDAPRLGSYHWHIKAFPRRDQVAGFELATGYFINPTPPELAAAVLRNSRGDSSSKNGAEVPAGKTG